MMEINKRVKECTEKGEIVTNGKLEDHKNGYINGSIQKDYNEDDAGWSDDDGDRWGEAEGGEAGEDSGSFEKCSLLTAALTHAAFYILMFLGFVNQLLFKPKVATEKNREGYAPLYDPFEQFYSRYVYRRVRHCFNRPISSAPGARLTLQEWETPDHNWSFRLTGAERRCINLGSYNYLGFAEGAATSRTAGEVRAAAARYGLALCSPRAELGHTPLHRELEDTLAAFLGVESAVVFGMGFATNVLGLPGLLGPGVLALSDEKNHASLILGLRLSRATVRVFRHNDVAHVEELALRAVAERKWRKIVVVVEGVYSMEGSVAPLAALAALKRRLGLQLYLDEAHSVGALGGGRGVAAHAGVPPAAVDVLMGTFTKSFGAAGGYIAGSRRLVARVRASGHAHVYAHAMAPCVVAQVLAVTRALRAGVAAARVRRLRRNAHYFRSGLRRLGVVTFGHADSPVVPMLVYSFSKMTAAVERLTQHDVAAVGVGFPATPLNMARIRFCLSAAHSRAQLDASLAAVAAVVQELGLQYSRRPLPPLPPPSPNAAH